MKEEINFESIAKKGHEKVLKSNSKEVLLKKEINFLSDF